MSGELLASVGGASSDDMALKVLNTLKFFIDMQKFDGFVNFAPLQLHLKLSPLHLMSILLITVRTSIGTSAWFAWQQAPPLLQFHGNELVF